MKIATYNLCFLFGEGQHKYAGALWDHTADFVEKRVNHFGEIFAQINADILFLQEVASEDVIKRIIKKTGIDYSYFIATPDNHGVGNAVLYKSKDCVCESVPAVAPLPVFVNGDVDTISPRIWSRRDFVSLRTIYRGEALRCLGVHIKANFAMPGKTLEGKEIEMNTNSLLADGFIRSEFFRLSQARKIRQVIDDCFATNTNVVVLGDFNSDSKNTLLRIIKGDIESSPDSLVFATDKIPSEQRFSAAFRNGNKNLIDYILLSKNLNNNLGSVQILNGDIKSRPKEKAPDPMYVASDHAPVVVDLS